MISWVIQSFVGKYEVLIPQTLVTVYSEVLVRYINLKDETIKVYKNTQIATINYVDEVLNEWENLTLPIPIMFLSQNLNPNSQTTWNVLLRKSQKKLQLHKNKNLLIEYQKSCPLPPLTWVSLI